MPESLIAEPWLVLGKAHGPMLVPSDVYKAAPAAEMVRFMDPISIEATLAADVPITWQGGDKCM